MLLGSFDNIPKNGFSGRKLTAFVTMLLVIYLHRKVTPEEVVTVIVIDCLFILLLMGIVTLQQITEFKNGGGIKQDPPANPPL
jgi:high-affinity K+ transport system ATPase subunit B